MTAWTDTAVIRALRTPKGAMAGVWLAALLFMAIFAP